MEEYKEHHSEDGVLLLHGDCLEVMKTLEDCSVDSVVTSPPYAMQRKSTYGGVSEKDYPEWTVNWMKEVWRILKDDGSVIINISPHVKNGELSDYVLLTRLALREAGWVELAELIWYKTSAMPVGNIKRPRRHWESLLWYGKHGRSYSDPYAAGEEWKNRPGSISRTGADTRNGWKHYNTGSNPESYRSVARVKDVASIRPSSEKGLDHPAPFPWKLAEWCGKLITPDGGTILDPFTGSSSTGVAALKNGWNFIGIDQSQEYIDLSRERLEAERRRLEEAESQT